MKEPYNRLLIDITEFDKEDVITTSAPIEVMPDQNGGGVIDEPDDILPFSF